MCDYVHIFYVFYFRRVCIFLVNIIMFGNDYWFIIRLCFAQNKKEKEEDLAQKGGGKKNQKGGFLFST